MQRIPRPRRYVSPVRLYALMPVLRFSYERGAYILRLIGETRGPVLRKDRRRAQATFTGPDRRAGAVDPIAAGGPVGGARRVDTISVRRVEPADGDGARRPAEAKPRAAGAKRSRSAGAEANPRRRQHGRQRPPRPRH